MTAWTSMTVGTIGLIAFWATAFYLMTVLFGSSHAEALGG